MNLSEEAAADLGERLAEARREVDPCRCPDCGPSPFEMRVAQRQRQLDDERAGRVA